jgi:hypothetical protein
MTNKSTLKAFAPGDILVGCTLLNDPKDDHAGPGRIIQYDANLEEKGILWTEGTTHLIVGLKFAPDKTLWAFDSNSYQVIRVAPTGKELPRVRFADRSFSNVNFLPDGNVLLGEHLVGKDIKLPPERPLGTTLARMPGSERFGDGHVFKFSPDGRQLKEFATRTHGGMAGFLGVTTASLAADGRTLVYTSETGPHVFQYDIVADRQLPDLVTMAPGSGEMALLAQHQADGTLLMIKANFKTGFFLQHLDAGGKVLREWPLPGPGWANIAACRDPGTVLLGNFFTGTLAKFDLKSGALTAKAETGVKRSLAGIAQYMG